MDTGLAKDFSSIDELKNFFTDENTSIAHLEKIRWNGDVISPFDDTSKIYKCKGNRYRCRNTGKYFNVKTATLFHNTKIDLQKWFIAIWLISRDTITSSELANRLGTTQKTAWLMQKRISRYISKNEKAVQHKQMQLTDWLSQLH